MAKEVYKIPADLDASYGDTEIVLSNKDGMSLRPLPVRMILAYVGSALLLLFIMMKTFIGTSSLLIIIPFIIGWIGLTILLCTSDKTKRMNMSLVPTLTRYVAKHNRHVITRTNSNATPFFQICGIVNIRDNGMIEWSDGTFGFMYRVTGTASVLLFDSDRDMILDRVDMFYRKLEENVEMGFITTKEAQKVYRQVANLSRMYNALDVDDADLRECMNEQYNILTNYVGKSFRSIHQYMYLKANNEEMLLRAKNILQGEVEGSQLMIKQCVPLYREDIHEVFRTVYQQQDLLFVDGKEA